MKGGVGKTTTAIHLAAGLAARGRRVLLIDADPQGNVGYILNLRAPIGLREVMLGTDTLAAAAVRAVRPNLDVLLATPAAFMLEEELAGVAQRRTLLSQRVRQSFDGDVIVVDTSPAMGLLTYNALMLATELVMPITMDTLALAGARRTLDGIREMRAMWPDRPLPLSAAVPIAVNAQTHASRAGHEALMADAQLRPSLAPGIRQSIDLTYAAAAHQTIWEYAPRSRAAQDYSDLLEFLEPTHHA
jgi:chromosome partitioning protein